MGSDLEGPSLGGPLFRPSRGGPAGPRAVGSTGPIGVDGRGGDLLEAVFAAVEAAPMPLVLLDPNRSDDPIVFANPAFLRMSGYGRAEVLGRSCHFLQGPDTDPEAVEAISRAVREGGGVSVELLSYRKDGTAFWNALSLAPVFDAEGRLAYCAAAQLDVSRRREAEEALLRTGDATGAERAVDEVAHDINNMVQVIAGHLEGLEEQAASSGDPRLARRLRAMSEAAARAAALTRELFGGSRRADAASPSQGRQGGRAEAAVVPLPAPADVRSGARILVVDDRAEVAELARTMLEAAGYAVDVAAGGRQALDKLPGGFDLLFSDLVMPGDLDGVGLAREAQRRHPRLRVLLTTGRAGPAGAPADAGGFETIAKPYRRSDLVRAVRRLLDRPDGAR